MSRLVQAKRTVGSLVLLMAAIVMLSGPVAGVLDPGSEPMAEAKKKHKKKKNKKNRPPAFNVVQCPGFVCRGTPGNDFLVGTPDSDVMFGEEGNDVYQANGDGNILRDESATSSDFYTALDPGANRITNVIDSGGPSDVLDMGSFRALDDVTLVRSTSDADDLLLNIDGGDPNVFRRVFVDEHFGVGRMEFIRFANGTLTGTQAESLAREATPEEQAELEESLPEEVRSSQVKGSPE